MNICQISDLHYCPEHLGEVDKCTGFAVDHAISTGVDCFTITGDIFDKQMPVHTPAVAAVLAQVKRMADHAPVIILQGTFSHDVPGMLDIFRTVGGVYPVCVVDSICQVALYESRGQIVWQKSSKWAFTGTGIAEECKAIFSCLPPVNKAAIAAVSGAENAAQAAGEYVHDLMVGWAVNNEVARSQGIPTVVLSHGTVNGCTTEQGVPMHGNDHEFTTGSLFASKASAIMLGHIHQFQEWIDGNGKCIAYPGSPGRLHFGETSDKGFLMWNVIDVAAAIEFVVTPAKRLIQIECDGTPDMVELEALSATAGDAHVRVRFTVDEENKDSVDKAAIMALFDSAAEVKIEGSINPVVRTRAAGITGKHGLEDKLVMWVDTVDAEAPPLLDRLRLLHHKDPGDIVGGVVGGGA